MTCLLFLLSYDRLSRKPLLFKSFTGLTIKEFDNIYKNEISKKYEKHEIKRLSNKKDNRKRKFGAEGRHFKLDVKNRFLILLMYYRLYITYSLSGFLFDLDQSNVCRDIQKIEGLVRKCVPTAEDICNITKRLQTPEEIEQYYPGFIAFTDCT
jgi:Helix-turn-helix of DDE superfamily endonuclease